MFRIGQIKDFQKYTVVKKLISQNPINPLISYSYFHIILLVSLYSFQMFRIVYKSIHSFPRRRTSSEPNILYTLQLQHFSSSPINGNKPISEYVPQHSFTVQYLVNEFGFSLEKAVSASKLVHFENRDKPDAVVTFLKNQGFTQPQIRILIAVRSSMLGYNPEKILLPKIDFFRSKGASSTDLTKVIMSNPVILVRSLDKCILPSFQFYKDFIGCDQSVMLMLKRDSRLLTKTENPVKENIEILRGAGMPDSRIGFLLKHRPNMFIWDSNKLKKSIEQVRKLGMDPQGCCYGIALSIMSSSTASKWNEKMEAYKRWGCSEDKVLASFKMVPEIMNLSKEKINGVMSFCVNEMGWEPSEVVRKYFLLTFSLNKRVVPRWSVYKELVSKRLVKGEGKLRAMFRMKEDLFLEKYVNRYKDKAPSLLKLYQEKLEASK